MTPKANATRHAALVAALAASLIAATAPSQQDQPASPAEIEPPKPIYKVDPSHPEELFQQGVEGHAVITFTVDMFGSVADPEVESASHEEFGLAALLAASEWIFEPATKNGVPIEARARLPFHFNLSFEHKLNLELGRDVFRKIESKIIPSSDLAEAPLPAFVPAFSDFYPQEFAGTGRSASLSVAFVIGPQGYVHNPRILSSSADGFDKAAQRAVSHMKYKPVLINGTPVYVSMLIPIHMSEK